MKIKIISGEGKWYKNRIGKIYHVKNIWDDNGKKHFVIRNYRTILRTVDFDDAGVTL